jgi:methyltransferase-like protein
VSEASPFAYDEVPYINAAFPQSHPDRMATLAKLFGMASPAIETCRVLELGCASGGNLISMAQGLPHAQFVGIDLSGRQIEVGRRTVAATGLANIDLRHASIADVAQEWGRFDYIISHGVYSWVPEPIREKLLAICHDNLAPNGVAYVSYNTFPGWRVRGMIRDMMVYHAGRFEGAAAKVQQARALLDFLAQSAPPGTPYGMTLKTELDSIRGRDDSYLFHDLLEEVNDPVYFHQFAGAAHRHNLQYLGDTDFGAMMASNFPPQIAETLQRIAPDIVSMEQYMDFVRNRTFRETLLVHKDIPLNRSVDARVLNGMYVASLAAPVSPTPALAQGASETFRAPNGSTVTTSIAVTKTAMLLLPKQWPLGLPFAQLLATARATLLAEGVVASEVRDPAHSAQALGNDMLRSYAAKVIELHMWLPRLSLVASDRPVASPLARFQAEQGPKVINLRQESVMLDGFTHQLLPLLDGTRDRDALVATLAWAGKKGTLKVQQDGKLLSAGPVLEQILRRALEENLPKLVKAALIVD